MADRSYRVLRVWIHGFHELVRDLYAAHPDLATAPYAEQHRYFLTQRHVYSTSFSSEMRRRGHWADELVTNILPMQAAWALENGAAKGVPRDPDQQRLFCHMIAVEQIKALAPDVVFVQGYGSYPDGFWAHVREVCPSIRALIGFNGFKATPEQGAGLDWRYHCAPHLIPEGATTDSLMYHWFDADVLETPEVKAGMAARDIAFSFIGSSGILPNRGTHQRRYWQLFEMLLRTPMVAWLRDAKDWLPPQVIDHLAETACQLLGEDRDPAVLPAVRRYCEKVVPYPALPLDRVLPDKVRPPAFGAGMWSVLARSGLTWNVHTDLAADLVGNMRMFEATGVGACLLTDTGRNMADLFAADEEVVTYRSLDEAVAKARDLLADDTARRAIAAAGQRRVLRDHTTASRVDRLLEDLARLL